MKIFTLCILILLSFFQLKAEEDTPENFHKYFALSLKDLVNIKVNTPSRKDETVHEAPNVVYVITSEEIKRRATERWKEYGFE